LNLKLEKLNRENLASRAYEGIKNALIKGHLQPGEKISIRKIAKEMGTSPTPVREALLQLVSSHALEMKPAHSVTVPVLTKELYLEIRSLRVVLEGMAVELATQRISKTEIKKLKDIDESMTRAKNSENYKMALEKNQAFHFELCKAAKMPLLLALIEILWVRIGPSLNLIYPPTAPEPDDQHCHKLILDALNARDTASARKAMEQDLIYGGAPLLEYLQKKEGN
jgi:DNA-binding GntR family transcriptional regulator